jgi:hypothetical protein
MGAMKSNGKLDKFRIQAEKIIQNQDGEEYRIVPVTQLQSGSRGMLVREEEAAEPMLPRLKLRSQSYMQDFMLSSAKKAY